MSRDHSQNHYGPNASFDGYDSDLASAGILIESLRQQLARCIDTCATRENEIIEAEQQLAAAIAACKLKDEALLLAAETYNSVWESHMPIIDTEMDKALTIQPDDSALKAWVSQRIASTFRKMK